MFDTEGDVIAGSATCASMRYLTVIGDRLYSSQQIGDLLAARRRAGLEIEVDPAGVSHLLHDGFIPQPLTIYRDIFTVSVGFSARLHQGRLEFHRDFPFALSRSRGDREPSTEILLDHLADATASACERSSDRVLLLSAGLDSTSLALAAKVAGIDDLHCVTYGEPECFSEVEFARETCRRLGLRHDAHILDMRSAEICKDLVHYAMGAPEPCADPAQTACVASIRKHCGPGSVVLDGSGSDFYFWSPPRPLDMLKIHFGLSRLPLVQHMRSLVPVYTRHERLLSSPIEPFLLHGTWLRHCDTRRFFPQSVNTHAFWLEEYRAQEALPRREARFRNRAMYVGPGAHMKKTRNAAQAVGGRAEFPWAAPALAEYCFNLPEPSRFDHKKSKILVRQMLKEKIDYDDALVGKRPFLFGKRRFLESQMAFCKEEILSCQLWSPEIARTTRQLSDMLQEGHPTENTLFALLMVSLWHNHWFRGALEDSLRAPELRLAI